MPTSPSLLLRVFAGAIFLSAALLFAVQPMFTKMVLPRLGGTPSVWSVAMVFFQAVLLAGYAYAHALTKYFPGRKSITIHLAVMAVACLFLPLSIATWWGRPPADSFPGAVVEESGQRAGEQAPGTAAPGGVGRPQVDAAEHEDEQPEQHGKGQGEQEENSHRRAP